MTAVSQRIKTSGGRGLLLAASNSPAYAKRQADYIYGSTENIATTITTWLDAGERVFEFAPGTFIAQDVPLREGMQIIGSGWRDAGGSNGGSRFNLPSSPTSDAMWVADTASEVDGGGVYNIYCQGDGTVTQKSEITTGGTDISTYGTNIGSVHCFDFSAVTTLQNWEYKRVKVNNFRRGHNGATTLERFIPVEGCEWWGNHTAFYVAGHPNFGINDFRYNWCCIGGAPFDLQCLGTKFNYSIYGIAKTSSGSAVEGATNTLAEGCHFFSTDYGAYIDDDCQINGGLFGYGATGGVFGIVVVGGHNLINGCKFDCQSNGTGMSSACIGIAAGSSNNDRCNVVSGCNFENRTSGGAHFAFTATDRRMQQWTISGNTFRVTHEPIWTIPDGSTNWIVNTAFENNAVFVEGMTTSTDPVFYHRTSTNKAISMSGNTFYVASAITVDSIVGNSLLNSLFVNNTIEVDGTATNGDTNLAESTGSTISGNISI